MNFKKNEKYAAIAFYSFVAICACALVVLGILNFSYIRVFLSKLSAVFAPFTYGLIIAYICNPVMKFFENKVFVFKNAKNPHRKLRRGLSLAFTVLTVIALISVVIYSVIPQIAASYQDLGSQLNNYITKAQELADSIILKIPDEYLGGEYSTLADFLADHDISFNLKTILTGSYSLLYTGFNYVLDYGGRFVGGLKNILLGFIIALYFLGSKEKLCAQTKKIIRAFTSRRAYLNIIRLARYTDKTFGGFIIGKIVDSVIIGLLTCVTLWFFNIPYYPLVSVIVGITNVIPFFGPFFGAIPSAFIIFIASPSKALLFVLLIIIIQQLDGNVIGPKILGDSIGISALWVVIAIIIAGGLFGFAGMLLGVPAVAVLHAIFKQYIEARLRAKNAPQGTNFYRNDPPLDPIEQDRVFIEKGAQIYDPGPECDIPDECPQQKKSGTEKLARAINKIKERRTTKGNK